MKIGIIGPSRLKNKDKVSEIARIVAKIGYEIVLTPDKGSTSEFFAQKYLENKGKKVYGVIPLDDEEFGYEWVNTNIGENINCGSWRNQPEMLNEEADILLSLGYAVGGVIEICYTKWFKKKPVFIVEELASGKLPEELEKELELRYVSINNLEKELENVKR